MEILSSYWILSFIFGGILSVYFFYYSLNSTERTSSIQEEKVENKFQQKKNKVEKKKKLEKIVKNPILDPLSYNILKGHTTEVSTLSWSYDGKWIASTSERSMRIYWTDTLHEKSPRFSNFKLPDNVTASTFNYDSSQLIFALSYSREILGFTISINEGKLFVKESYRFATEHKDTIKSLSATVNSNVILTCGDNTIIFLYNSKGNMITTLNTNQMKHNMGVISPDGKLFAIAAWTADVKVWHINYNKSQGVEKVSKVMDLGNHRVNYIKSNSLIFSLLYFMLHSVLILLVLLLLLKMELGNFGKLM